LRLHDSFTQILWRRGAARGMFRTAAGQVETIK
jgi:hypothetical protein